MNNKREGNFLYNVDKLEVVLGMHARYDSNVVRRKVRRAIAHKKFDDLVLIEII